MARAGFLAQGIVWLALIALGIIAVRQRRFADHARLMLAMAAVASGALVGAPDDHRRHGL